jgi:hypothetical protein
MPLNGPARPKSAPACGRRGTTPTLPRCRAAPAAAPSAPTPACRSAAWPTACSTRWPRPMPGHPLLPGRPCGRRQLPLRLPARPGHPRERETAEELNHKLVARALSLGGTCTGEHGVGLHKMDFLVTEAGAGAVDMMRTIKRALDPKNIMNPGKIHFAKGQTPYFDLSAIRVPYKADSSEIERRKRDALGRRATAAGFGRDRTKTYLLGGADPGNVVSVAQTYNQYKGVAHTAAMPEGLAEFFIKAASPQGGIVVDPFAGGGTTVVVARRLGRASGGFELHQEFVNEGLRRIAEDDAEDIPGRLALA